MARLLILRRFIQDKATLDEKSCLSDTREYPTFNLVRLDEILKKCIQQPLREEQINDVQLSMLRHYKQTIATKLSVFVE